MFQERPLQRWNVPWDAERFCSNGCGVVIPEAWGQELYAGQGSGEQWEESPEVWNGRLQTRYSFPDLSVRSICIFCRHGTCGEESEAGPSGVCVLNGRRRPRRDVY